MRNHTLKSKSREKPLLFVIPGVLMLLAGFGIMVACSLGGRMLAAESLPLPLGLATAAVGGMVLTRTMLATFFLFIFSLTVIILGIRDHGIMNPALIPFAILILLCLPMAKYARR